jgi:hypothetical protein
MGYQESFIQFSNRKELIEQLRKYKKRDTKEDLANVLCVDRVRKAIEPFEAGELVIVVGGERSEQRSAYDLERGTGIKNVESITFIDNYMYAVFPPPEDFRIFLQEHFECLTDAETESLIGEG